MLEILSKRKFSKIFSSDFKELLKFLKDSFFVNGFFVAGRGADRRKLGQN